MLTSLDDRDGFIWLDGELTPWRDARLHVLSHALHMGGSVFEGMRAYDGHVFLGAAHLARLSRSATLLDYQLPWSGEALSRAIDAVLAANGLRDAYIRPIAWRGTESVSIASPRARIHVAIAAWDWPTAAARGEAVALASAPAGHRAHRREMFRPLPDLHPRSSPGAGGGLRRRAAARQ
jgi:branched-chain amino acid aminotransferase